MQQLLIPILAFVSVTCLGSASLLMLWTRRRLLLGRIDKLSHPYGSLEAQQGQSVLNQGLGRLGHIASKKGPSESLRQNLAQAGYRGRSVASVYLGIKLLLFFIGLIGCAAVMIWMQQDYNRILIGACMAGGFLSFLPNMVISMQAASRRMEIMHHLPDAVDLLEICVSSGMGLDMAWNSVGDEIRPVSPILADEMALTNLEISLGETRAVAMRHMSDRTGAEEINSLVAVLVQSERFGTSIGEALRTFAGYMRELRSQRAEEHAEKMSIKLLFPMVVLIFPSIFIVTVGPAAITIIQLFATP